MVGEEEETCHRNGHRLPSHIGTACGMRGEEGRARKKPFFAFPLKMREKQLRLFRPALLLRALTPYFRLGSDGSQGLDEDESGDEDDGQGFCLHFKTCKKEKINSNVL